VSQESISGGAALLLCGVHFLSEAFYMKYLKSSQLDAEMLKLRVGRH
jgi:hypothetical protein